MKRSDNTSDFFGDKRVVNLCRYGGQRRDQSENSNVTNRMAFRPFVSGLSVVTAYIAFAFVGAIVLGVF